MQNCRRDSGLSLINHKMFAVIAAVGTIAAPRPCIAQPQNVKQVHVKAPTADDFAATIGKGADTVAASFQSHIANLHNYGYKATAHGYPPTSTVMQTIATSDVVQLTNHGNIGGGAMAWQPNQIFANTTVKTFNVEKLPHHNALLIVWEGCETADTDAQAGIGNLLYSSCHIGYQCAVGFTHDICPDNNALVLWSQDFWQAMSVGPDAKNPGLPMTVQDALFFAKNTLSTQLPPNPGWNAYYGYDSYSWGGDPTVSLYPVR